MYSTLEERCFSRGTAVVFPSHPACFILCVYLFDIATSYSNLISRSCSSLGRSIVGVMAADFKRKPQVISRDEINFQTHQNPFGENIKMSLILSGFSANAQISFHTAWRGTEAWGLPLQIWGLEPASPWCLTGKLNVFGFGYSPHFSRAILFFFPSGNFVLAEFGDFGCLSGVSECYTNEVRLWDNIAPRGASQMAHGSVVRFWATSTHPVNAKRRLRCHVCVQAVKDRWICRRSKTCT